jgi:hypothetical protein
MRQAILLIIGLVSITSLSSAEIPQVISYQGKVTDSVGTQVADNTYTMRFRIYDAATAGTVLWDSGNQSVAVAGGVFSVLLGESPQPTLDLPFDADYWLLVTFSGANQTPRQHLSSTGYAYMASGLVAGTETRGLVEEYPYSAISGINEASIGPTFGLQGISFSNEGVGVQGEAPRYGGRFICSSTIGDGVFGRATATSGSAFGGNFQSYSTDGMGVCAVATALSGSTYGVFSSSYSTSGTGLYGRSTATGGTTYGVLGTSASPEGRGVLGIASCTELNGQGVRGEAASSDNGVGVYGLGSSTTGLNYGVFGRTLSTDGYGVYSAGNFVASGTKSCVVRTSRGPTLMYCQESPENWFEDFGEGQLVNGRCRVELDPLFLETVTIDEDNPIHVFIQLHDADCQGVAVERGQIGFDVVELKGGTSDGSFSYRIVAKRNGFEAKRLDYCAAAERDGYLFPELRQEEIRECEETRMRIDEPERLRREKSAVRSQQ